MTTIDPSFDAPACICPRDRRGAEPLDTCPIHGMMTPLPTPEGDTTT